MPAAEFFIRTGPPSAEPPHDGRLLLPGGRSVSPEAIRRSARNLGAFTLECSGNFRQAGFGMLSRALFSGVPLADVLDSVAPDALLEVGGASRHASDVPATTSWIFRASDLLGAGAFLATSLGGAPLSPAHGAPVRLVVPGWYGCCAIKWVRSIAVVPPDAPATRQMSEYASRTHQDGVPERARDFRPATVACAAIVTRVTRAGRTFTAEGLVWGGTRPVASVVLRVNGVDAARAEVAQAGGPRENWGFFRARFDPGAVTEALLDARIDASAPQPRVDAGWYARRVALDGV